MPRAEFDESQVIFPTWVATHSTGEGWEKINKQNKTPFFSAYKGEGGRMVLLENKRSLSNLLPSFDMSVKSL